MSHVICIHNMLYVLHIDIYVIHVNRYVEIGGLVKKLLVSDQWSLNI